MNILPRLLYLFQALPVEVPQHQFLMWDKLISSFICDGKKPRLRYSTLELAKHMGGLALPNLKYFYAASFLQTDWWGEPEGEVDTELALCGFSQAVENVLECKVSSMLLDMRRDPSWFGWSPSLLKS